MICKHLDRVVNIGDTRVSFSWEHLDDGSVSEAAIELKAHAEVRTLRFFVLASSWFILLSRRLRCLYLPVHRLLQSSSAVAAAERLICPPVHTPCLSHTSALGISSPSSVQALPSCPLQSRAAHLALCSSVAAVLQVLFRAHSCSTLYSASYPVGVFLLFLFSQNKLVSFSPLVFNTSAIDFCGIY